MAKVVKKAKKEVANEKKQMSTKEYMSELDKLLSSIEKSGEFYTGRVITIFHDK